MSISFSRTVDKFLLGSKDNFEYEVTIENQGDDAFEATFYSVLPQGLIFKKATAIGDASDNIVSCTTPRDTNIVKCDIGNPMAKGKAYFKIALEHVREFQDKALLNFYFEVNSTNTEKSGTFDDNIIKRAIPIWVQTNMTIEG